MIGHEFDGKGVTLESPYGGEVSVALGKLTMVEGAEPTDAVAFRIADDDGGIVAEFCLRPGTFLVLLEAMMATFQQAEAVSVRP